MDAAPLDRLSDPVTDQDHILGPADAAVTLVEFGDFECPDCGRAYPLVKELHRHLDGQLRFVFRHFPLTSVHAHASVAAQAAEAAAAQGKFWEMHDLLYENQKSLAEVDLTRLALRAGLELYRFEADLSSDRFAQRVRQHFEGGVRSGVKGTPTLFINDTRYRGKLAIEPLLTALQRQ